jgi:hypothetical protein
MAGDAKARELKSFENHLMIHDAATECGLYMQQIVTILAAAS